VEKFEGLAGIEAEIGKEAMVMVLSILGGDAGRVRYIPSPQAWAEYLDRKQRKGAVLARFECLLREEARRGAGFTLRAYRAVAVEVGLSVRQVQRIIAER